MKVLEVTGDPPGFASGLGQTVSRLVTGLSSMGYAVDSRFPQHRVGELKFSPIAGLDFSDYDVVHVHGPTPFLSDIIAFNRSISHLVLTYHADVVWISSVLSKFYDRLHLMAYKYCDAVVVESADYAKRVGRFVSNVRLIRPPAPSWAGNPDPEASKSQTFTVLYVGQFRPFKGIDVLLRAARRLPSVKFVVAGNGYLEAQVIERSRQIPNLEVRARPSDDQVRALYESAHVICLPSTNTTEAYGFSLLEGALCGAYPIASGLPGVSENIEILGGRTFTAGDDESLANEIHRLESDVVEWSRLSRRTAERARTYATKNTTDEFVREHARLFSSILAESA